MRDECEKADTGSKIRLPQRRDGDGRGDIFSWAKRSPGDCPWTRVKSANGFRSFLLRCCGRITLEEMRGRERLHTRFARSGGCTPKTILWTRRQVERGVSRPAKTARRFSGGPIVHCAIAG